MVHTLNNYFERQMNTYFYKATKINLFVFMVLVANTPSEIQNPAIVEINKKDIDNLF